MLIIDLFEAPVATQFSDSVRGSLLYLPATSSALEPLEEVEVHAYSFST